METSTWKEKVKENFKLCDGIVQRDIRRGEFRHAGYIFTIEAVMAPVTSLPEYLENRKSLWKGEIRLGMDGYAFSLDKAIERIESITKRSPNRLGEWPTVGFDICSNCTDFVIYPGTFEIISTGLFVDLDNTDGKHELQIRSRSGLAAKYGLFVLNSPGTIDPTYPDEIKVILHNLGDKPQVIGYGDRIAQGVVVKIEPHALGVEHGKSKRQGGLGSTGK